MWMRFGGRFRRINKAATFGVDGVTKEQYGENLEVNLRDLHKRRELHIRAICFKRYT
jgi:hypothetical protein